MTTALPGDRWPMPYMSMLSFRSDSIIKSKDSRHMIRLCFGGLSSAREILWTLPADYVTLSIWSRVCFCLDVPNRVPSHFVKLSISISVINFRGLLLILNIGIIYSECCPYRQRALSFLPYACAHFSLFELRWPGSATWVSGYTWWRPLFAVSFVCYDEEDRQLCLCFRF